MPIEDTSQRDPAVHLLGSFDGPADYITGMEAAGQRQLVLSESLPTDLNPGREAWEALGFTFGQPSNDPLFQPATLPAGWTKRPTDHSMWSEIFDAGGVVRARIFYKAAFYDRSAFASLVAQGA